MNTNRKTAAGAGALFLIALLFALFGSALTDPILNAPDYLSQVYPNKMKIISGSLFQFICAPAMMLIPVLLYPVLKKQNERLALGYVVFRLAEGILYTYLVFNTLSLIDLSGQLANANEIEFSFLLAMGNAVKSKIEWSIVFDIVFFTSGAAMFYYLLYRARLVPRWLSLWGLAGAAVLFSGPFLFLFGAFGDMALMEAMPFFAPLIALNELVLSIWLMVRGFEARSLEPSSNVITGTM